MILSTMISNMKYKKGLIMNKFRNCFAGTKNKIGIGVCTVLVVFSFACKTYRYETARLKVLKDKQEKAEARFNIAADSCLYFYGEKMPEGARKKIYASLPGNPSKKDSVELLLVKVNEVLPLVNKGDPKYVILENISKAGVKATLLWPEYENIVKSVQESKAKLQESKKIRIR